MCLSGQPQNTGSLTTRQSYVFLSYFIETPHDQTGGNYAPKTFKKCGIRPLGDWLPQWRTAKGCSAKGRQWRMAKGCQAFTSQATNYNTDTRPSCKYIIKVYSTLCEHITYHTSTRHIIVYKYIPYDTSICHIRQAHDISIRIWLTGTWDHSSLAAI